MVGVLAESKPSSSADVPVNAPLTAYGSPDESKPRVIVNTLEPNVTVASARSAEPLALRAACNAVATPSRSVAELKSRPVTEVPLIVTSPEVIACRPESAEGVPPVIDAPVPAESSHRPTTRFFGYGTCWKYR